MIIHNPAVRRYIYIVAAAVIAVLVLLGFVVEDHVQVWLNLVAALLGLPVAGLAAPNTPKTTSHATTEAPGIVNVYSHLTPGDHVIQADVAPTQHHLDYDANLTADETVSKPHEAITNMTSEEYHDFMHGARQQQRAEEAFFTTAHDQKKQEKPCPTPDLHGNPFRYCPNCNWTEADDKPTEETPPRTE